MTANGLLTIVGEYPIEQLHTGVRARVRHIVTWNGGEEASWRYVAIRDTSRRGGRLRDRLDAVVQFDIQQLGSGRIIVLGLGSPVMIRFARRLIGAGYDCTIDLCDSVLGQIRDRVRRGSWKDRAVGLWVLGQIVAMPQASVSYISRHDSSSDGVINCGRRVTTIPYAPPPGLDDLEPPRWPLSRIVLAGDLKSFHNAEGLRDLFMAVSDCTEDVIVHLYGPEPPHEELPEGFTYVGWAPSVAEIYAGDSLIFVANRKATGKANKLYEAIAAKRWILAHHTMDKEVSDYPRSVIYRDSRDLATKIDELWGRGRDG